MQGLGAGLDGGRSAGAALGAGGPNHSRCEEGLRCATIAGAQEAAGSVS